MAEVRLSGVSKSFGRTPVLAGVSADIRSGEFISLLGASGCGKTTLLRIVAGLESVDAGAVEIEGRDVTDLPPERRDIAMMFQSYALLPHLSVAENVRFPLRMRRIGTAREQAAMVADALDTVRLSAFGGQKPRQLSGGQQQRVALARAIVSRPKVLLLDEPLSNLDARLREDMHVELIELHKRLGLTTIFVTHDQEEALSLSDRIILLHQGMVEQEGTPAEIYRTPCTSYASSFLGAANIVPVTIVETTSGVVAILPDSQTLPLPLASPVRKEAVLAVRQEDIGLVAPSSGALTGMVRTRVYLGARCRYVINLGDQQLRVLTGPDVVFAAGDAVGLAIAPGAIRVLN
jgi:putative spermidine/putrescine transport system ATP-binding protein